jgi:hypothetical protein
VPAHALLFDARLFLLVGPPQLAGFNPAPGGLNSDMARDAFWALHGLGVLGAFVAQLEDDSGERREAILAAARLVSELRNITRPDCSAGGKKKRVRKNNQVTTHY